MKRTRCLVFVTLLVSTLATSQSANEDSLQSPIITRTASLIGVVSQMRQLTDLEANGGDPSKAILLREQILSKVVAASLQVDATVAQIDNEIAQSDELRGYLADKRDKAVNRANLWSIIAGGGLGATSAGLQIPSGQKTTSAVVGIAGGALSAGLAISGIHAQKGGTRVLAFDSNMLAEFFDRPAVEDSHYDPIVWHFLNEVAATDPDKLTRKERLIHTWYSLKRIDPPSTPAGKRKVERVTSQPSDEFQMTIDDLEDRSAMLQDVRAKISFLKRDLAALLSSLPSQ